MRGREKMKSTKVAYTTTAMITNMGTTSWRPMTTSTIDMKYSKNWGKEPLEW